MTTRLACTHQHKPYEYHYTTQHAPRSTKACQHVYRSMRRHVVTAMPPVPWLLGYKGNVPPSGQVCTLKAITCTPLEYILDPHMVHCLCSQVAMTPMRQLLHVHRHTHTYTHIQQLLNWHEIKGNKINNNTSIITLPFFPFISCQ